MHSRRHGFTVFDVLVTLAIAALVMVLTVPGIRAWSRNTAMSAALSALQADLRLARAEAIRLRQPTVVCPKGAIADCSSQPDWHAGWLVFVDSNGDRSYSPGEPALRTGTPIEGLNVTSTAARSYLRFSPRGSAPGSNATLTFCDDRGPGDARQMRLSASGRVRVLAALEVSVTSC